MTTTTEWAAGTPCERHEMGWCTDCRDLAGIVRHADGSLGWKSDCAVQTFSEITGADSDEAFTALTAAGYRIGRGTPFGALAAVFLTSGYAATRSPLTIEEAVIASRT